MNKQNKKKFKDTGKKTNWWSPEGRSAGGWTKTGEEN